MAAYSFTCTFTFYTLTKHLVLMFSYCSKMTFFKFHTYQRVILTLYYTKYYSEGFILLTLQDLYIV